MIINHTYWPKSPIRIEDLNSSYLLPVKMDPLPPWIDLTFSKRCNSLQGREDVPGYKQELGSREVSGLWATREALGRIQKSKGGASKESAPAHSPSWAQSHAWMEVRLLSGSWPGESFLSGGLSFSQEGMLEVSFGRLPKGQRVMAEPPIYVWNQEYRKCLFFFKEDSFQMLINNNWS